MNSKNITHIKALATISMVLEGISVLISMVVLKFQHSLTPIFMNTEIDPDISVYPATVFLKMLVFVILFLFFRIALNAEKKTDGTIALLLVIFYFLIDVAIIIANIACSFYYARQGSYVLAMYSSVSSLISYGTILFEIPAVPLFFIAYGRYAALESSAGSPAEETPSSPLENVYYEKIDGSDD